jgi:hypothetical protein
MLNTIVGVLGDPTVAGDFQSIATTTVGAGGASSITFSSIPSTFTHLQVRAIGRSSNIVEDSLWRFNGDTTANYAMHLLVGDGSTAASYNSTSATSMKATPYMTGNTSIFGIGITDVLDYANTNKYKTIRTLTGMDNNNNSFGQIQFNSGLWQSTAAITSITITPSAGTYVQYSQFALYGIKG